MTNINDKHKKITFYSRFLCFIFLLACFAIPFGPAITMNSGKVHKTYGSSYAFIFGGKISTDNIAYSLREITGLGLAGFILLSVAIILLTISFFIHNQNLKHITIFIVSILILISAVLFLNLHKSISNILADALIKGHSDTVSNTVFNNSKMEFGTWGVSIMGAISDFCLFASLFFDGSFDKIRVRMGLIRPY